MDHDGGYLRHWYMGKPTVGDYEQPLRGIPFAVAQEFAAWLGGRLPSAEALDGIFYGADFSGLAALYQDHAAPTGAIIQIAVFPSRCTASLSIVSRSGVI